MRKPTLELIAKECGVTKGLVSRALAGKNNVSDQTREKIIRKATELGYDTKRLRNSKSNSSHVLLVTSTRILFKEDFWQPIITSISSTLSRSNLIVEYLVFDEDNIDSNLLKKLGGFTIEVLWINNDNWFVLCQKDVHYFFDCHVHHNERSTSGVFQFL